MSTIIVVLTAITFFSTLLGGLLVLRYRKSLPYIFSFAAGTLIAVAFLELLPESLELGASANIPSRYLLITAVLAFFFYNLIEKFFATHHMHDDDGHGHIMGPIGAGSLVLHSFFDGAAIGAAFQVNAAAGLVVALAVIFHDFTDGINTVTVMLRNKHSTRYAILFLILDAVAPVLGVLAVTYFAFSASALAFLLAIFVGEFIYIGAATLVPETRHASKRTVFAMALGILLIIVLTTVAV